MRRHHARDPGRPPPGTPAEQARWICSHPTDGSYEDGQRIVELLTAGREVHDLHSEELELLARGLNWWGKHERAFAVAKLSLSRTPHDQARLRSAGEHASNAFADDVGAFADACDDCIAGGLGPEAYWQLLKADEFISVATGESELEDYEWRPGHPIRNHEFLRRAADALAAALRSDPSLRDSQSHRDWVGDWNRRFAAVVQQPEFRHLAG